MVDGKIFGIGLNKTGTRSLASALRTVGFRTLHKGDQATSDLVDRAARDDVPLLSYIGSKYDAYLDVHGLVTRYADLDEQYPGSRFILTTRELEAWLDSREKHARANQQRAGYSGRFSTVDRAAWEAEHASHDAAVLAYFDGRSDLLVMDIAGGDGWERLAPFLGVGVPRTPFPWENREGKGTYRPEHRFARAQRRAHFVVARFKRLRAGG